MLFTFSPPFYKDDFSSYYYSGGFLIMDKRFILITPEQTLLDKRMARLKERLEKCYKTTLLPDSHTDFSNMENSVFVLPFSLSRERMSSLFSSIPMGEQTFGGELSDEALQIARERKIHHTNLLSDEEFCQDNALLTAEAALACLISSTETSLYGMRCAVFGYGRIGKRLTRMLLTHSASVKVFTSDKEELSCLSSRGIASSHLWQRQDIDSFSAIINTIPLHHVIPRDTLLVLDVSTFVLDLASGANNVDWASLKVLGLRGEHATSLPGKVSPASAAAVMEKAILKHLN